MKDEITIYRTSYTHYYVGEEWGSGSSGIDYRGKALLMFDKGDHAQIMCEGYIPWGTIYEVLRHMYYGTAYAVSDFNCENTWGDE